MLVILCTHLSAEAITNAKMTSEERLLRRAYVAFNNRDLEALMGMLHPGVDWANGVTGGRERGTRAVREYWRQQFRLMDSKVYPQSFTEDEQGRIVVTVHQVVHDNLGEPLANHHVKHVYTLRDGLIFRMDIGA